MKIRTGFVTNSSSSSFILAFKDGYDYGSFHSKCEEYSYDDFLELVESLLEQDTSTSKTKAMEMLENYYTVDFKRDFVNSKIKHSDFKEYRDYMVEASKLENSEECKEYIESKLAETDYYEKKHQLEEAEVSVMGTIWDTDGGLLEWAIRNGFISSEFKQNCILTWNIG